MGHQHHMSLLARKYGLFYCCALDESLYCLCERFLRVRRVFSSTPSRSQLEVTQDVFDVHVARPHLLRQRMSHCLTSSSSFECTQDEIDGLRHVAPEPLPLVACGGFQILGMARRERPSAHPVLCPQATSHACSRSPLPAPRFMHSRITMP